MSDLQQAIHSAILPTIQEHLQGKHNQMKHAYRYGSAPSLATARKLKKSGLLSDYKDRLKAKGRKSGKERNAEKPKKTAISPKMHKAERQAFAAVEKQYGSYQGSGTHRLPGNKLAHGSVFGNHLVQATVITRQGAVRDYTPDGQREVWNIKSKVKHNDGFGFEFWEVDIDYQNPIGAVPQVSYTQ